MGVIRGGKQATAEWLRNMERMIESQPHSVYVLQDKRALRDYARELDVELVVGDKDSKFESKDEKGDEPTSDKPEKEPNSPKEPKGDDYSGDIDATPPGAGANAGTGKPPTPGGGGPGQSSDGEGNRGPHKYIRKYKAPSGNTVYVYHLEGPRRTGFGGEPEVMPKSPAIGQKRAQVSASIKERAHERTGRAKKDTFDFDRRMRDAMNVPEQTQSVVKNAVAYLGGDKQGEAEFTRRFNDWIGRNKHLEHPQDKAFAMEMLAREVVGAHQQGRAGVEPDRDEKSRYAERPGGYTPKDPALRQPWQLTRDEFNERQEADPKLKDVNYEHVLAQAAERKEYIPNHVLGQDDSKDKEFSDRMHEFKQDYLEHHKPEVNMAPETQEYVKKFDKLVEGLPKHFDGWVKPAVKREGDKYLNVEKASGYNIDQCDSYDVSDAGIYSHMMTAPETIVMYHQYAAHAGHGREILAMLHEHGVDCEYTVVKRGSAVAWNNDWAEEPEMTYRETGETDDKGRQKRIGYSSDYVLAFKPKDKKQATDIAELLREHAHAGAEKAGAHPHQAIHRSWYVPDVRASTEIAGYKKAFLNVKTMGHQELCIVTKHDFIKSGPQAAPHSKKEARLGDVSKESYNEEFKHEHVYVDKALHDVIKAMFGYGRLGRGEVVIVEF